MQCLTESSGVTVCISSLHFNDSSLQTAAINLWHIFTLCCQPLCLQTCCAPECDFFFFLNCCWSTNWCVARSPCLFVRLYTVWLEEQVSQRLSCWSSLCLQTPHQSPWRRFSPIQNTSSVSTRCSPETLRLHPSSMLAHVSPPWGHNSGGPTAKNPGGYTACEFPRCGINKVS